MIDRNQQWFIFRYFIFIEYDNPPVKNLSGKVKNRPKEVVDKPVHTPQN